MAYRLFEGKEHASIYQQYRFTPPSGLKDIIIQYLDKKVGLVSKNFGVWNYVLTRDSLILY